MVNTNRHQEFGIPSITSSKYADLHVFFRYLDTWSWGPIVSVSLGLP